MSVFTDEFGEFDLALCLCCEEKAAIASDPDVGPVCAECSVELAIAHARLVNIEGVKICAEVRRSRS